MIRAEIVSQLSLWMGNFCRNPELGTWQHCRDSVTMFSGQEMVYYCSVAEPKLFIFGSGFGSTFVHNFGSGSSSSYSHILPKLFFNSSTILIEVEISFSLSSKLTAENIYYKDNFGSTGSGSAPLDYCIMSIFVVVSLFRHQGLNIFRIFICHWRSISVVAKIKNCWGPNSAYTFYLKFLLFLPVSLCGSVSIRNTYWSGSIKMLNPDTIWIGIRIHNTEDKAVIWSFTKITVLLWGWARPANCWMPWLKMKLSGRLWFVRTTMQPRCFLSTQQSCENGAIHVVG